MSVSGDRMKKRRKELGISAEELAKRIGKDRATVFRYERGDIENVPLSVIRGLSEALQVSPGYLMGWEEQETEDARLNNQIVSLISEMSPSEKSLAIEVLKRFAGKSEP